MHRRATAWIAIGLISRAADITPQDALDLIRAYAWQQNQTIDDISYELASHTTLAEQLLDPSPQDRS